MKHLHLILLSAVLIGQSSGAAHAQPEEPKAQLIKLSLDELMDMELAGASKKATKAKDVAAAVSVITADDIQRYGYRTLSEALKRVAGLYLSSDRNYEYLGVRGFSQAGDFNTRILLLVDGHRMNDSIYDEAPLGENLPVDIESIERIEVIKGPSSAAWGTNALLGVINLVLKKGESIKGGRVLGEGGSHSRLKGYTEFGTKSSGGFELAGAFGAMQSDGQGRIYYPEYDAPETNFGAYEDNDTEHAYRGYLKGAYEGLSFLLLGGSRNKHIPTSSFETTFNDKSAYTVDSSLRGDLAYQHAVWSEKTGKILARVYYDYVPYHGYYPYGEGADRSVEYDETVGRLFGGELRYSMSVSQGFNFVVGAEHQNAYDLRMPAYPSIPEDEPYSSSDNSFKLDSAYLEADYQVIQELKAILGGRYDYYSTFGGEFSPRAALVYSPIPSTDVKLSYGQAFRAPNNFELNYGDSVSQIGNGDLEPEEMRAYELIVEHRFSGTRLSINLFHQKISDLIGQVTNDDDLLQYQNLNSKTSRGIEFQADARLEGGVTGYANFSFLRTEDSEDHSRSVNAPNYLGALGVSIPVYQELYVTPELALIGDRKTLYDGATTGTTFAVNLTLLYRNVLPGVSVSAGAYNLFDRNNYSTGGEEHLQRRIPQDGQTFRVQVAWAL